MRSVADGTKSAQCSRSSTTRPYNPPPRQSVRSQHEPPPASTQEPPHRGPAYPESFRTVQPPPSQFPETSSRYPSSQRRPDVSARWGESREPALPQPPEHPGARSSESNPSAPPAHET